MAELKNVIEEMVKKELENIYQRNIELCKCPQCRNDIIALALNNLPAQYVTGRKNSESLTNKLYAKYYNKVVPVIMSAIETVKKHPRQECEKVKSNFYVNSTNSFLSYYQP